MGGSKKKVTTGYNYFGSMAQVICAGPIDVLHKITNGETEIFAGPLDVSSADANGRTVITTTIGTMRFYWGKPTQAQDSILALLQLDLGSGVVTVPASNWKNVCYCVCDDIAFGGQVTPPTLLFEVERKLNRLALTTHTISGDAVLPEVIYDWLTDLLYGAGIPAAKVDSASFIAAAEEIITEGLGCSPYVDDSTTLFDLLGQLMPYIDCFPYFEDGKIKLKLIRKESSVGILSVDESKMTDEPKPANQGWGETWNYTNLKFTDRENAWQSDAIEPYDDAANAAITSEMVPKELSFPYVTRRDVAKKLARRKGIVAGIPQMFWSLSLLPSLKTMVPGQLFKLSFAKRGIVDRLMRVVEINRGGAGASEVTVKCMEEQTRSDANDYTPPSDTFGVDDLVDTTGGAAFTLVSTTPRLSWLAPGLKDGLVDGFLVAAHRPNGLMDGFEVWYSWDPTQNPYTRLNISTNFPCKAVVKCWHRSRNNVSWIFRIEVAQDFDRTFLMALMEGGDDAYFCVGRRLFKSVGGSLNQHQTDVLWFQRLRDAYFAAITATIFDIEVTDSAFAAPPPILETLAGNGTYPTEHLYGGRKTDFALFPSSTLVFEINQGGGQLTWRPGHGTSFPDTAKIRYVKAPAYNFQGAQALADVTAATYDRDDPTMEPDGTYSTDWGALVRSSYEIFDDAGGAQVNGEPHAEYELVGDFDDDLGATLFGLESVTQAIKVSNIDDLLGFMVQTGVQYYNVTY